MATILLVPDLYFHRWDHLDGELWLCLRPFVKKDEFGQWASDPDASHHKFELPKSPNGTVICKPQAELRSINLPTSVDLWMRIVRGGPDPAPWIRVARSKGCVTDPGIVESEHKADFGLGAVPDSFAKLFNESVKARCVGVSEKEAAGLADWLELRLESGKTVKAKFGSQLKSLYRNEADPSKPPIPFFRPDGPWSTQFATDELLSSNMFWFNGLMLPLGRKPVAASIANITGVDLWLVDNAVDVDATEPPPEKVSFPIHLPQFAAAPSAPYFSEVQDSYAAHLVCRLEDPSVLNARSISSTQERGSAEDPVAYFSPAVQGYQKSADIPLKEAWEFVSRMGANSAQALGLGAAGSALLACRRLLDMVGIEVRSKEVGRVGSQLNLRPGIVVTGKIRPYRRFPRITGQGSYLPTVMAFEPAGDGADILESVEALLGVEGSSGLKALFSSAIVAGGWRLQLLSAGKLPWDGPRKVYRVLATRVGEGTTSTSDVCTCEPQSVTLSLRAPQALTTREGRVPAEDSLVHWLWKPDASVISIEMLRSAWSQQYGPWAKMPINALFVEEGGSLNAEIDAVYLGDYTFFQANSRTRLEQVMGVYVQMPNLTPADCVSSPVPSQDFEDDLTNFNTASALTKQGDLLDDRVRFAQKSSRMFRGLNRRQAIPFVFEWPHAPQNEKGDNPSATVTWQQMRDYVKRVMLEPLPTEPFQARLEHTYCTSVPAVDETRKVITLQRARTFDWMPDLPTAAELDAKGHGQPNAARFLECRFEQGAIYLDFHPFVLDPSSDQLKQLSDLDRRALSIRAWRSVGEMLSAKNVALDLDLRLFDMAAQAGPDVKGAEKFSREGFTGHWRDALRDVAVAPVLLPPGERQRLADWCSATLQASSVSLSTFTLRIPLGSQIGEIAHVARVNLVIERTGDEAPPDFLRLVPITQQPTLGPAAEDSLWGAWTQIGFDRNSDLGALPKEEQDRLRAACRSWHASLVGARDSVSPATLHAAMVADPQSAALRGDLQALVAELPGTDWFTPAGSPSSKVSVDAQLTLLPLGFAPCARHPQLGSSAQQVLQRALAHLNDAIDVSYLGWARNASMDWIGFFRSLESLASLSAQGQWVGPVPDLIQTIVAALLRPQPDSRSPHVDSEVVRLIDGFVDKSTPVGQSPFAVQRLLLQSPALFSDAKAFLMTRVGFVPSVAGLPTPPPYTLARAQFTRSVRPRPTKGAPVAQEVADVESVAGWRQMVPASLSGEMGLDQRLGFIEVLDDARYDNAFSIRAEGQRLQAFEDMVDADRLADPQIGSSGSWASRPPIVPGKAENAQDVVDREVRLASRAVVEPPQLLWCGESASLLSALANVSIGQRGWTAADIARGRPPTGPGGSQDGLEVAAFRRPGDWKKAAYADEVLVHFVYRVTGDEEATAAGSTDSFDNDGFFLETLRTRAPEASTLAGSPPPTLDALTEATLRSFATVERGSSDAAKLALEQLVGQASTYGHLTGLVQSESAASIPSTSVMLRPTAVGSQHGDVCVGGGLEEWRGRVRDVCLLRPVTTEPNSTAYLVVSVMLDVWSGWDATLTQGRNMPFEQWDASCSQASGRVPPPFNPVFWQAAAQTSRPMTQHVNNVLQNASAHWGGANRTFKFPAAWHGMKVSAKTVLDQLLFTQILDVGDSSDGDAQKKPKKNVSPTILRPKASEFAYGVPLGITIYQEQFGSGGVHPQEIRFPFPTVICQPSTLAQTFVEFPEEYATFSLDIRWRKPDGATPLILERIFAVPYGH